MLPNERFLNEDKNLLNEKLYNGSHYGKVYKIE